MDQVIQITGAMMVLAAYAGNQMGRLDQQSYAYMLLNLVGAVILATVASFAGQLGFAMLNTVWAIVSVVGLITKVRKRKV